MNPTNNNLSNEPAEAIINNVAIEPAEPIINNVAIEPVINLIPNNQVNITVGQPTRIFMTPGLSPSAAAQEFKIIEDNIRQQVLAARQAQAVLQPPHALPPGAITLSGGFDRSIPQVVLGLVLSIYFVGKCFKK